MKRIKTITSIIKTRAEMERVVSETVALQIQREQLIARRDEEIKTIQEKFGGRVDEAARNIENNVLLLEQWSEAHPEEFGRDKSILVEGHRMGWRIGQPMPKPLRKQTWKTIMERLFVMADEVQKRFIRTKYEPNKEAMVAARETDAELLREIGVEIVQSESFYLDPAREGQPEKRLVATAKEAA
jgi:phage host-nuclease inhibitor protein Gam